MIIKKIPKLFVIILLLSSCSLYFLQNPNQKFIQGNIKENDQNFSIVFSHDINGQIDPCGCQHHPLGGILNVAKQFSKLQENGPFIYVDIGDTFYPRSFLLENEANLGQLAAKTLKNSLEYLNLSFYVPGEKDFALGVDSFKELLKDRQFKILISNIKDFPLDHLKWAKVNYKNYTIYMMAILDPLTLSNSSKIHEYQVEEPIGSLKLTIAELKKNGFDEHNLNHQLILLSHSGKDRDIEFAQKIPELDWIIGSHSMAGLQKPIIASNTKIVQAFYENRYIGQIFPFLQDSKVNLKYITYPIIPSNNHSQFKDLQKILSEYYIGQRALQEQQSPLNISTPILKTSTSCFECHQRQYSNWSKTSHALAYWTLIEKKQDKNLSCIKCHALGHQDPFQFDNGNFAVLTKINPPQTVLPQYWKDLQNDLSKIDSVRALSTSERIQYVEKWHQLDVKYQVKEKFANVQCLHCHQINNDHPSKTQMNSKESFQEAANLRLTAQKTLAKMQGLCLKCHTIDQSPNWSSLSESEWINLIKSVSCM